MQTGSLRERARRHRPRPKLLPQDASSPSSRTRMCSTPGSRRVSGHSPSSAGRKRFVSFQPKSVTDVICLPMHRHPSSPTSTPTLSSKPDGISCSSGSPEWSFSVSSLRARCHSRKSTATQLSETRTAAKCRNRSETSLTPSMSFMARPSKSSPGICDWVTCPRRRFKKPRMDRRRCTPRVSRSVVPMLSDSRSATLPLVVGLPSHAAHGWLWSGRSTCG